MQGASSHVDVSQRKLCVAALVKLLKVWGGEGWFRQYAIDSIGVQCCVGGMLSGGVDVRDGGVLGLLTEVLRTVAGSALLPFVSVCCLGVRMMWMSLVCY